MIEYSFSIYDLEYFLLILCRVSAFVFVAPFFGMRGTPPNRYKIAFCIFTAMLLYQSLTPARSEVTYDSILGYSLIVLKEVVTGLILGFGANACTAIVNFAGSVADMETGLSMATLLDPATNQSTSITGVLYQYGFMLMLIASGMYRYLLGALADSFSLIPVNGAVFHGDRLVESMLEFMTQYILIGFRIVLPIFCVILLLNAVLGVLAKVAPQMNMFAVGMQLKVLVGLSVLFLSLNMLGSISEFIFDEMKVITASLLEGMM